MMGLDMNTDVRTLDELKSKQSKERKELLAKLTSLKHGLTKNDKKRKKDVSQQCEQMEAEMKRRHEKEMEEFEGRIVTMTVDKEGLKREEAGQSADENGQLCNHSTGIPAAEMTPFFKEVKLTKTQLKKERKRTEKADMRNKAVTEDAKNAPNSQGNLEIEAFRQILTGRALELVDVPPDGDCLYNAMAHQANISGLGKFSATEIRRMTADYIQRHREEFLPFLVGENADETTDFDVYCSKVSRMCASGGSWGGEPELRALSAALQRRVEVLHSDGRTNEFGGNFPEHPLVVTYHKSAYTLGEHYNSTKPIKE